MLKWPKPGYLTLRANWLPLKVTWALALNWKSLELICGRPVHHGFSLNDKADAVAMLAENLETLWATKLRPKGTSS